MALFDVPVSCHTVKLDNRFNGVVIVEHSWLAQRVSATMTCTAVQPRSIHKPRQDAIGVDAAGRARPSRITAKLDAT